MKYKKPANIYRPIKIGKEVYRCTKLTHRYLELQWILKEGGKVKMHYHRELLEHFVIDSGELICVLDKKVMLLERGDRIVVRPGQMHSLKNESYDEAVLTIRYSPPFEVVRMMEILSALDFLYPHQKRNRLRFDYIAIQLGFSEFYSGNEIIMSFKRGWITLVGVFSRWDKLVKLFPEYKINHYD